MDMGLPVPVSRRVSGTFHRRAFRTLAHLSNRPLDKCPTSRGTFQRMKLIYGARIAAPTTTPRPANPGPQVGMNELTNSRARDQPGEVTTPKRSPTALVPRGTGDDALEVVAWGGPTGEWLETTVAVRPSPNLKYFIRTMHREGMRPMPHGAGVSLDGSIQGAARTAVMDLFLSAIKFSTGTCGLWFRHGVERVELYLPEMKGDGGPQPPK